MGCFHVDCTVEHIADRAKSATVEKLLVDTGCELTRLPTDTLQKLGVNREKKDTSFVMANGTRITRRVGFVVLRVDDAFTVDEVVFAEEGDLSLLGARTLEGMNLTVDATRKKLVSAGPMPAAGNGSVS